MKVVVYDKNIITKVYDVKNLDRLKLSGVDYKVYDDLEVGRGYDIRNITKSTIEEKQTNLFTKILNKFRKKT